LYFVAKNIFHTYNDFIDERRYIMTNYMSNIRKNIKKFRAVKGVTQENLAEISNISPRTVNNLENESTLFKISSFLTVAQALDMHPFYFFCDRIPSSTAIAPYQNEQPKVLEHKTEMYFIKYIINNPEEYQQEMDGCGCKYKKSHYSSWNPTYGFSNRYGIEVFKKYSTSLSDPFMTVLDISDNESYVEKLVGELNTCEAAPCHLFEILEDFYVGIYSRVRFY